MASKHLHGDYNYAWPTAEIAVMGAKGAAEIIFKGKSSATEIAAYEHAFQNPLKAAERGYVDDIILPSNTRAIILDNLKILDNKLKIKAVRRHSNLPL